MRQCRLLQAEGASAAAEQQSEEERERARATEELLERKK
jgi:hypothetical protein